MLFHRPPVPRNKVVRKACLLAVSWAFMAVWLESFGAARGQDAGRIELVPHRAVYVMELGRARSGGNVAGAKGVMVMEWAKSCAGWTVKQRLKLDLVDNEGTTMATEANFSSFEALDGLSYRVTARNTRNGRVTEDIQGSASLKRKAGTGTADFTQPKGVRFDLPRGTVFPTEHVRDLIGEARRGKRTVYRVVFDGATLDGPLEVNAVIGNPVPAGTGRWAKDPLTNRPSWHMRLAFFPLKESKAEPDYELGLRLFDNGVADDFELDYGAFAVNARLERIEPLEVPRC